MRLGISHLCTLAAKAALDTPNRTPPVPGWETGLLIRGKKDRPHQFMFYLTGLPEDMAFAE